MNIKEYLIPQNWVTWRIDGAKRKYFQDTAFGPMWKDFPPEVEVPPDLQLDSIEEIHEYLGVKPILKEFSWDDLPKIIESDQ
jgi:hypothetical protein